MTAAAHQELIERLRERAERIYDGYTPTGNIFGSISAELSAAADALEAALQDSARIDALAAMTKDVERDCDVTILGPGNHGGEMDWLVSVCLWDNPAHPLQECEGKTLREAIDSTYAARGSS